MCGAHQGTAGRRGAPSLPSALPGGVPNTEPRPVAAAARCARGANTAITWPRPWETPGKSGVARGCWKGDSRGRTPGRRVTTTGPLPQLESLFRISSLGTLLPRYAPLGRRPQGPHAGVSPYPPPSALHPRTRGRDAGTRAREHTRTRRPPWDVNKPRTPGCGRPSRECSHRVTYVHTLPPPARPSWMDADASQPPSPFLPGCAAARPASPAPQHPAKLASAPTWSLGLYPSSRHPPDGGDPEHQQRPAPAPRPRHVLGVREPYCLGAPRPRSRPGPAFLTPPRARFSWRPWLARVSLPSELLSQPAPGSVSLRC